VRMTAKDVTYIELAPNEVPLAVPDEADAGLTWEPFTSQAIKNGIRVLYQSPVNSSLEPRLLAFRAALVEQNPEVIRKFLLAWQEGVDYRNAHPEESIAIISELTGLTPEEVTLSNDVAIYTLRDNLNLFSDNPGKDPTSIYYVARMNRNFLVTNGYLTIPPDIEVLLDPSFLE
jgi:NitT/TauT family transport system substrate-binding protein